MERDEIRKFKNIGDENLLKIEKDIFDYLNYSESSQNNVKSVSKVSDLDIVACVENIEE